MQTSLYIHIPWCIRKCPYCDFNSHKSPDLLPEKQYIMALIDDLKKDLTYLPQREISSIFIGGGTPSLLSADAYNNLFESIKTLLPFANDIEITLEANPGTFEAARFKEYRQTGINRLSLGVQSFNAKHLKLLGRIHDDEQARFAIATAREVGFANINIDIMYGLPQQTLAEGLADLSEALEFAPEHLSWYQLTLEPNTVFYKKRPKLPNEAIQEALETQALEKLQNNAYERYEISAFCRDKHYARHNMNYWLFGDYYGIGAGAHGKLTDDEAQVFRTRKHRLPNEYLDPNKAYLAASEKPTVEDLLFEFMLNTTRLEQAIPYALFKERTGLSICLLEDRLKGAEQKGLIQLQAEGWQVTKLGRRYTNDLQALFLGE